MVDSGSATNASSRDDVHRREVQSFRDDRSQLFGVKRRKNQQRRSPSSSSSANATATEAASIQQSLSRTRALLRSELDRVSHVSHAIEDDGKLLKDTMQAQETMNVSSAKKALTALERAQQVEHRVLVASIVFFWCVVFYVLWGRVLCRLPLVDTAMRTLAKLLHLH